MQRVEAVRASDPGYDTWRKAHQKWRDGPQAKKVAAFPKTGYEYFPPAPTEAVSNLTIIPGTHIETHVFDWEAEYKKEREAHGAQRLEYDGTFIKQISIDEATNELIVMNESGHMFRRPLSKP